MDRIRTRIEPGDIGYVIYLHGILYAREFGLDHTFEADVARGFGEFAKGYDPAKDLFALAEIDGRIVGSIVIAAPRGSHAAATRVSRPLPASASTMARPAATSTMSTISVTSCRAR